MKEDTLPWHACRPWSRNSVIEHLRYCFKTLYKEDLIRIMPSNKTLFLLAGSRKLNKYILKWIESIYGRGAWASNLGEYERFPIKSRKLYNTIHEDMGRMVEGFIADNGR